MVRTKDKPKISNVERKKLDTRTCIAGQERDLHSRTNKMSKISKINREKEEMKREGVKKQTEVVLHSGSIVRVKGEYTIEEKMHIDRIRSMDEISMLTRNNDYIHWVKLNMEELSEIQNIFASPNFNELCNHAYHTRSIKGTQPMEDRCTNLDHMMDYCYYNDMEYFIWPYDYVGHSDEYMEWIHTKASTPTIFRVEDEGWIPA
jgi:hypothetical protein